MCWNLWALICKQLLYWQKVDIKILFIESKSKLQGDTYQKYMLSKKIFFCKKIKKMAKIRHENNL